MSDESFPIISVDDVPAVVGFYERLGFAETYRFPPDGDPAFVVVMRGESSLGISLRTATADAHAYWVYVDDVDATVEALVEGGAELVAAPEDRPWGERVASVRDPAGTLVHLGAPVSGDGA